MASKKSFVNKNKGATLIEVLISLAIVGFLVVTLYLALNAMVSNIGEAKQRTGAIAIANEKMEIMRNLEYEEVGTVSGIINGPMLQYEEVTRNNFTYRVYIDVRYVDDELDGTEGDDLISTDYKLVQIEVEWDHFDSIESVQFTSNFVPDGIETDMGGGSLVLNSMTSGGDLVGGASVNLTSLDNNPTVDYNTTTDNNGSLILQGVPSQNYRITLSKSGYEEVQTYPDSPLSAFNPINKDFYVSEGALNSKNFYINPDADLTIKAIDILSEDPVSGLSIELKGGQLIGTEPDTYNFSDSSSTDSQGEVDHENISPGFYEILNKDNLEVGDYDFVGSLEEASFNLLSGEDKTITLNFADKNTPALFLEVSDNATQKAIKDAVVAISGPNDFNQSASTDENGIVFFPLASDPQVFMENSDYSVEIRMSGYSDYLETITINDLTKKTVELNSN
jgi:type II secretory pathway pseudopilin PulG